MNSLRWDSGVLRSLGQALTVVLVATLLVLAPSSKNVSIAVASDSLTQCQQSYTTVNGTGSVTATYSGGFCYVAFKNLGPLNSQVTFSWNEPQSPYADILIVAGGGGAGNFSGGGAGEFVQRLATVLPGGPRTIVVGAGGSPGGGVISAGTRVITSNGQPSAFGDVSAEGGGGGAQYQSSANDRTGASGGGGGTHPAAGQDRLGGLSLDDGDPNSFGNSGGAGRNSPQPIGGGGGGAGEPGQDATVTNTNQYSMKGGDGLAWPLLPVSVAQELGIGDVEEAGVYFAGGGGGWYGNSGVPISFAGGRGGGGSGASYGAGDAQAHTGGGGGGSNVFSGLGGDGGSGVVLVRYAPISSIDQAISLTSFRQVTGSSIIPRETSASFSMEAWVYPTDLSGWKILLNQTTSIPDGFERTFIGTLNGEIQFAVNGGAFVDTNVALTTDRWQHVAMTVNGSVVKVFLDGFEVHSSTGYSRVGTAGAAFHLGGSHVSNEYWVGSIDQVKIWPAALSQSDIETSMHTYSSSGIAHSLHAHFDFNSVTTGLELDRSGNGRHLTLAGSVLSNQYTTSQIVETGSVNTTDRIIRFKRSYLTATGGWTPPDGVSNAELLLVGGGGGGSGNSSIDGFVSSAGAGGGGGVLQASRVGLAAPSVVKVGVGGLGGDSVSNRSGAAGFRGQSSAFRSLTAGGGGAGGCEAEGGATGAICPSAESSGGDGTAAGSGGSPSNFYNAYSPGFAGTATQTVMDGITYAAVPGYRAGYYNDGVTSADYSSGSGGGAGGAGNSNTPGAGLTSTISGEVVSYGGGGAAWNSSSWSDEPPVPNRGSGGNGAFSTSASAGYGGSSGVVILRFSLAPDAPTSLTATQSTSHSTINLSWTAPSYTGNSSITDYDIEYKPAGGSWTSYSDGVSTATTRDVLLPQQCIAHEFRVIAKNSSFQSVASATASATPVWGTFGSLTGVLISSTNSECVVKFTSTASATTWTPPAGTERVRALAVGGGGGGAAWVGAGGGAGGFTESSSISIPETSIVIEVGAGGSGGSHISSVTTPASNGHPSTISAGGLPLLAAAGGGRGAGWSPGEVAGSGGSGGGGNGNQSPGLGLDGQGFSGGTGQNIQYSTGGGGGAGGPGEAATTEYSGDGGPGKASNITGTQTFYAGGGGGGYHGDNNNDPGPVYHPDSAGDGGVGGGGDGGQPTSSGLASDAYTSTVPVIGESGLANTGGGGGGAGKAGNQTSIGGSGGSGVVILRQLAAGSPEILTQPLGASTEPGQTKTLNVIASGNGTLSYQWQSSSDGTSWTNVGTNSSSFISPALTLADNGIRYRVIVTNTLNSQNSVVTSSEAVISVVGVTIGSGLCETMVSNDSGATVSQTAAGGCLLEFTTPGNNLWFVPANVSSVEALVVGGGGGGASGRGDGYDWYGGGAGGGGGEYTKVTLDVTSSQQIPLVVGAGGAAGGASARGALPNPGGQGGNSSFSVSGAVALGGSGGQGSTVLGVGGSGGAGGSGTGVAGSSGGDGSDGLAWRSYERPTDGGAAKLTTLGGEQYCLGGGGGGGNRGAGATHFYYQAQGGDCSSAGLGSGGDGNYFNGSNYVLAAVGIANTGGGGGGGSYNSGGGFAGAAGASGLVALYYVPGAGAVSLSQPNAMSYSSTANTTSVTLTKTSPGNASWTTSNQAICTVSGDNTGATVTVLIAGACAVSVTVAASGGFSTGSAEVSFRIDKITQAAPGWDSATATVAFGGTLDLYEKLASPSGIANYSFTATGTGCAVTGVMLTVGDAGSSCSVTPTVNSTGKYLPATGTSLTVSVTKISQSALVLTSATSMNVDQTLTLSAAGGSGTGALSYHVANQGTTGCSVNSSTGALTATAAGSCEVYAKRALSTNYDEVTSSNVVITINKISQNLSWVSQPQAQYVAGNTYALEATASSQLTIAYSISAGLCTLAGTTVTFTGSGDCVILAGQSGNSSYLEAVTISQTVSVGKINQTMTFSALANKSWGSLAFSLSATASSALAITYTENNQTTNDACDVSTNGIVTIKNVGTCAITATQAGNSAYTSVTTTRLFDVTANQAGAPFIGSVSFGDRQLNASFFTPSYLGGGTVSAYELRAYELDGTLASTNTGCISQPGSNQSCSVIGLTNGVTYVLKVAAITQAGLGQLSASSSEVTPASNPEAVGNLAAFEGDAQLTITWTPPTSLGGGTFDQYRIFWRAPGGNYQANGSPGGTVGNQASTSFVITGLTNGVAYDVKVTTVTSVNTLELQSNTAEVRQTPFTVPDAPAAVVALDNDNNVVVAWQPPVFDGGNPIDQYVVEKDGTAVCTITSATTTSCEVARPSPGSTEVIQVRAGNDAGLSAPASTSITIQSIPGSSGLVGGSGISLPGITPGTPAPIVLDVSGSSVVKTNELIRLAGTNFNLVDRVLIGNIEASFFVNSAQLITIRIPIDAAAGKPTITLQGAFGSRIFTGLIEISVTQVSIDTKVTIGTFLGYAAVYTKNHEGKRLSMKIGNKWRVIDPLGANYTYNLTKVGTGRTVTVMVYIDRVLVQVKQIKIQ